MSNTIFYREQKTICGKNYETAGYMEIDLYQITPAQHRMSIRGKKKEATSLAQQTYNDKRAKRYHVQLVNTNFGKGDFSWTGTYNDEHLPEYDEREKVDRDWTNFMKRVFRFCDKQGIKRPKWIMATEYSTLDEETNEVIGRHHHHAIIEHTEGLTRDILEELWRDRQGKSIGLCRCEYLQVAHGSVESLLQYISKNKRCDRSWRQSKGLDKPKTPRPNDTKWSAKRLHEASTLYIDDKEFWQREYPGYMLERVETKVSDAGARHTTVIMYRDEVYKRSGNILRREYG